MFLAGDDDDGAVGAGADGDGDGDGDDDDDDCNNSCVGFVKESGDESVPAFFSVFFLSGVRIVVLLELSFIPFIAKAIFSSREDITPVRSGEEEKRGGERGFRWASL